MNNLDEKERLNRGRRNGGSANTLKLIAALLVTALIFTYLSGFAILRWRWDLGMFRVGKGGDSTIHRLHNRPRTKLAYYTYWPLFELERIVSGRPTVTMSTAIERRGIGE